MAEYSYNGWLASKNPADFGGLVPLVVAGESFPPGVRAGDFHTVALYVAQQLHLRVEPVVRADWHQADDWGYNYRPNRNANNLSCHASGTAFDYNATRHPNGKRGTFSPVQVAEIRLILAEVDGVMGWGGDFSGTPDEMHFEAKRNAAAFAGVANRLRSGGKTPAGTVPVVGGRRTLLEGMVGADVWDLANFMNRMFPRYASTPIDLDPNRNAQRYGPQTVKAMKEFQARSGLVADGITGPNTYAALARIGFK